MANDKDNKHPEFVVTDRRKFNLDGEARPDTPKDEEPVIEQPAPAPKPGPQLVTSAPAEVEEEAGLPATPSQAEQQQQADAYRERSKDLDERLQKELDAHGAGQHTSDFEMSFEKFVASLYMTALMQLGLVHQEGAQPRADLIGARQTIDTISILAAKTRGNLNANEEIMINNCLYELRMAYVEITSAITRPPSGIIPPDPGAGLR